LNILLNYLEERYDITFVIALHPKADYKIDYFNGRECFKYETIGLIKNAEFILSGNSIALIYGVLAKKPILIYDDYFFKKSKNYYRFIKEIKRKIGLNIINKQNMYTFTTNYKSMINITLYDKVINENICKLPEKNSYFEFKKIISSSICLKKKLFFYC